MNGRLLRAEPVLSLAPQANTKDDFCEVVICLAESSPTMPAKHKESYLVYKAIDVVFMLELLASSKHPTNSA